MGIGPIVNLAGGLLQSLFSGSGSSSATNTSATTNSTAGTQDTNRLSPFAQILSSLQSLQQSNPTQYQQVTQQISSNLQTAAQTATSSGNTSLATQLTQLSKDFQSASSSGQLPNVSDLAQAVGGGGHHHHHRGGAAASGYQQAATSTSSATDPLSIISATLTTAGVPAATS